MSITWLFERMARRPDVPALIWNDTPYTYAALLECVDRWRDELDAHAVQGGQVVALEGDYSPAACSLLLALIERGCILVPLTDSVVAQREEFLQIAEVQVVVSFDAGDDWRIERRDITPANPLTCSLRAAEAPGLVLFSSGSTGKSKAALHNFVGLLEKFQVERHARVTLTFLLLDHIGGINTLLYTFSNSGTVVSVRSRDPDVVCKAIADHHVQSLPTSPTFLNLLLISEAYTRHDLRSLELITYGTEVMPASTLERIHALFPQVQLLQTYGLSELGILRSKSRSSDSLWVKVGGEGYETRIVAGVLHIRARSAMLGYLNAPSPFDEEGWFNTQDMVEVDGEYLRILGRRSEIINVGGQKVYPAEVESVLLQAENIRDAAVVGEANPITGQMVVARVNLFAAEDPAGLKRRLRAFCRERLAAYKIPVKIEISANDQHSARFKKMRRSAS
ncbi:MAG: long-chain fatty acid--CoA ligase [Oscillochloris sp.]|nr:long-chain fatty acid--CoA ligase [Oscillochloris sp.]